MTNVRLSARTLAAMLALAAAPGACKEPSHVGEPPRAVGASSPHDPSQAPIVPPEGQPQGGDAVGDGEVFAVLATADTGEIQQGTLARTQGSDARVRAFGQAMVTMHTEASARMTALRQRLGITPRDNPRSQALAADAAATQQRLASLRGADFDRAYVDAQVAQHARVLDLIDSALLPMAHAPELRTAVGTDARPMVAAHLQQARDLQASMNAPAAAQPTGAAAPGAPAPAANP